jgi:hypothetical protein
MRLIEFTMYLFSFVVMLMHEMKNANISLNKHL